MRGLVKLKLFPGSVETAGYQLRVYRTALPFFETLGSSTSPVCPPTLAWLRFVSRKNSQAVGGGCVAGELAGLVCTRWGLAGAAEGEPPGEPPAVQRGCPLRRCRLAASPCPFVAGSRSE